MAHWFRMYESILDDPKVQKLPPRYFKAWVNLLCLASRNDGEIPSIDDIAFALRTTKADADDIFAYLFNTGFLDRDDNKRVTPHNWASRQYKSDGSAERMRRHRDKQRNVTCDVTVTPSESETDTEADTEKILSLSARAPTTPKNGARIPDDWTPCDDDRTFAEQLGIDVQATAAAFADYWRAKPGAGGRKLDWSATWRNWCRRETGSRPVGTAPVRPVHAPRGNDAFFEQLARIASRDSA